MSAPRPDRVRIRFDKWGPIRFTSHRDVARLWERTLRRCRVPVAYSEGFSPRPRLRFGLALATAYESCGEYLDIDLALGTDVADDLPERLTAALPPGMHVHTMAPVVPGTASLQEAVDACEWLVELPSVTTDRARDLVAQALAAPELPVTRERKGTVVTDDIRPSVLALDLAHPDTLPAAATWRPEGALVRALLAARPRACRPSELVAAFSRHGGHGDVDEGRVIRLHQWTNVDDDRAEPLPRRDAPLAGTHGHRADSSTAPAERQAS